MNPNNCNLCHGSGIYYKPNGEDDFDAEYCACSEGEIAEKTNAMRVLPVKFDQKECEVKLRKLFAAPTEVVGTQIDTILKGIRL